MPRLNSWFGADVFLKPEDEGGGAGASGDGAPAENAGQAQPASTDAAAAPAFDWGRWTNQLEAEKKDYATRFRGPEDLLEAAASMRRDLSTRIKVPGKDASPEDIAVFRKAIGGGEKPEDYKVALPEKYELGEAQTALLGAMQKSALEAGMPVAAFEGFTKTYFEMEQAVRKKLAEEVDQYRRESEAALRKEFGGGYDKFMRAARGFIEQRLNVPEFNLLLEETVTWNGVPVQLGSHPAVIKMLAQIGQRTSEDGVIGHRNETDKQSLQKQIRELEATAPLGSRSPAQDRELQNLYSRLYD